jgi:hypothetical protein
MCEMNEEVRFKYYKPIISIIANIVWVIIIASSAYFLLNNFEFPMAIKILLGIFSLMVLFGYFIGDNIKDLSGKFILRKDNFDILTSKKIEYIYYSDIVEIKREYYEKTISLVLTNASQYNPGKYTIRLKNGYEYNFCVSDKEEKMYCKKIKQLNKKIYELNALGVHFNTKKIRAWMSNKEKEEMFEREKPRANFSVENAIIKLLEKSGIELNDLTIEK